MFRENPSDGDVNLWRDDCLMKGHMVSPCDDRLCRHNQMTSRSMKCEGGLLTITTSGLYTPADPSCRTAGGLWSGRVPCPWKQDHFFCDFFDSLALALFREVTSFFPSSLISQKPLSPFFIRPSFTSLFRTICAVCLHLGCEGTDGRGS